MKQKILLFFILAITVISSRAQTKTGLHIINTFHIASTGGWDYLEAGPVHDWLYVSHGTQVNIINKKTATLLG